MDDGHTLASVLGKSDMQTQCSMSECLIFIQGAMQKRILFKKKMQSLCMLGRVGVAVREQAQQPAVQEEQGMDSSSTAHAEFVAFPALNVRHPNRVMVCSHLILLLLLSMIVKGA